MIDADVYRRDSRRRWGSVARGWKEHRDFLRAAMPVSLWMADAIAPQPGHRVLELAAGTGEVGFLAAELIRPGGELICSDFAPEMLTAAQELAAELGLDNVRFKQIDAESIDVEAGTLDGVLCRWGYMLMADPSAALRETRRVLKPGGRVALAAWTAAEDNPWSSVMGRELVARGLVPRPQPGEPGQFAWAGAGVIEDALRGAGFVEGIDVEEFEFTCRYRDFEDWWETTLSMSARSAEAVGALPEPEREDVRAALRAATAPFEQEDGTFAFPARSWVAAATA